MKTVCLDVRALQTGHARRGIGVFVRHYLETVLKFYPYESRPSVLVHHSLPFPIDSILIKEFRQIYFEIPVATPWVFNQIYLSQLLNRFGVDIYHALSPLTTEKWLALPYLNNTFLTIATVHDLNLHQFSKIFKSAKNYTNSTYYRAQVKILKKAWHIVVNSNFVKRDIIQKVGVTGDKISTIYPGVPYQNIIKSKHTSLINLDNYVLFIGEGQPKNLITCLKALSRVDKEINLIVVARRKSCKVDVLELCDNKKLKHRIIFAEDISNEILIDLYENAICLIFPSYGEGFGFPVVEAMSRGCPVICSNVTSLPEISGNAAILIEPDNDKAIAENINFLYRDKYVRNFYKHAGKKKAEEYSWTQMILQYDEVYKKKFAQKISINS